MGMSITPIAARQHVAQVGFDDGTIFVIDRICLSARARFSPAPAKSKSSS